MSYSQVHLVYSQNYFITYFFFKVSIWLPFFWYWYWIAWIVVQINFCLNKSKKQAPKSHFLFVIVKMQRFWLAKLVAVLFVWERPHFFAQSPPTIAAQATMQCSQRPGQLFASLYVRLDSLRLNSLVSPMIAKNSRAGNVCAIYRCDLIGHLFFLEKKVRSIIRDWGLCFRSSIGITKLVSNRQFLHCDTISWTIIWNEENIFFCPVIMLYFESSHMNII